MGVVLSSDLLGVFVAGEMGDECFSSYVTPIVLHSGLPQVIALDSNPWSYFHVRYPFAESLVVMLSILYNILDDDGCSDDGVRLLNYISLVEEAEGFDRTVRLMNKHDDREVYDKASPEHQNKRNS